MQTKPVYEIYNTPQNTWKLSCMETSVNIKNQSPMGQEYPSEQNKWKNKLNQVAQGYILKKRPIL